MSRNGDLPEFLSQMKGSNPVKSILATTAVVLALTLAGNLIQVATFTSLTILLYYSVTNASALRIPEERRLYPKLISVAGLTCCIGLALSIPAEQWIWTLALLALGMAYAGLRTRLPKTGRA